MHALLSPAVTDPQLLAASPCAHPASAGPENVQCRSVFIQFLRVLVSSGSLSEVRMSNPFLTHGTVESPAKLFTRANHCVGEINGARPFPISPEGSKPTPFAG